MPRGAAASEAERGERRGSSPPRPSERSGRDTRTCSGSWRSSSAAVSSSSPNELATTARWTGGRAIAALGHPPARCVSGRRGRRAALRSSSPRRAEGGWGTPLVVALSRSFSSKARERYRGRLYSAAKNSCWAVEYGRALGEAVDHDGRGSSARRGGSWLLPLRLVERAREDVVGDPVEVIGEACPVPGLVGPERAERLERPAASNGPSAADECSAVTAAMPA